MVRLQIELQEVRKYLREFAERYRREVLAYRRFATYLTWQDLFTSLDFKRPSIVIIESGNGTGKTQSACDLVAILSSVEFFDRIYILEHTHSACANVENKLAAQGIRVIHYYGLESGCKNRKLLQKANRLCGVPSLACKVCPYFKEKHKAAYKIVEEIVTGKLSTMALAAEHSVCYLPLLKAFIFNPSMDDKLRVRPIIVVPYQVFATTVAITRFTKYRERQAKERRVLMILDESDEMFYSGFKVEIPDIEPTDEDKDLLKMFSPKTRPLDKILTIFEQAKQICEKIVENRGRVDDMLVKKYYMLREEFEPLLRSFDRRRKQIINYVVANKIRTNIFMIVDTLTRFFSLMRPDYSLKTCEYQNGMYVITDYDFMIRFMLDPNYPYKSFWKILLSATFPTEEIVKSIFIAPRTKKNILSVRRKFKTYINVFITAYEIFPLDMEHVNRNYLIGRVLDRILACLFDVVYTYHFYFKENVNAILMFTGNKTQFNVIRSILKKKVSILYEEKDFLRTMIKIDNEVMEFAISYCGSTKARSLDFDHANISIVLAPLLRPPRWGYYWDIIDFQRSVAEIVQAAMRIVRSPCPPKPKLIVLDCRLLKPFYYRLYPRWFKFLIDHAFIKTLPNPNSPFNRRRRVAA